MKALKLLFQKTPIIKKSHHFYKIVCIIVCIVFFNVNSASSQDIAASKVIMNSTNLTEGYIYLSIPIYEDVITQDEGIPPSDSRAGKIVINGKTVLRFWSFAAAGTPQSFTRRAWHWVRSQECRTDVSVRVFEDYGTDVWENIVYQGTTFNPANYTQTNIYEDGATDITWAQVRVCLPTAWIDDNLDVYVTYYIDVNAWTDHGQSTSPVSSFTGLTFPIPSLSQSFSSTPGKYDITATISPTGVYSKYEYSLGSGPYTTLSGSSATIPVNIMDTEQTQTVNIKYTLGYCSRTYETSSSIPLPAYPQATNFTATQQTNGNTEISWDVNTSTGTNYIDGDEFEIQRADNENFNNAIAVGQIEYEPTTPSYYYIDENSEENLNGRYYYRIRRTKTQNEWGWNLSSITSVDLSMAHRHIANANVQFGGNNIAVITWNYDDGNVWTDNSSVIIERYNITNGGAKEVITVPADSMDNQSYSEELILMCNKFIYKIYVRSGSTNYLTQDAISVDGDNVVPIETGNLLSVNSSKGYFSERTEVFWETDGKPIDFFTVKSRIYQSGLEFKQIDQVLGASGSKLYQYNDEQSSPGEIYEYQIIGIIQCADVTVSTDTLYTYGFRTPTGDIYGRVTFEDGQAEENVEVRLETDDGIMGKSMNLTGGQVATIDNISILETNTDSITIQAWIAPDNVIGTQIIFRKNSMYELGINEDHFYFSAGNDILTSNATATSFFGGSDFAHLTGVKTLDSIFIYINGQLTDSKSSNGIIIGNTNQAIIGENFSGAIDEVRVWNRPITVNEITRDYKRYITGGETGLIAYWSFNYATSEEFYDRSYNGSSYNENHGHFNDATLDETRIPTSEQLGYKGVTRVDGSYEIRAIPYIGNGTVYTIVPRLGIHQFESQEEIRFIGEGSQSHTVNFIDKSSFKVTGTITYDGGTVPVEGVSFTIDGVVAMGGNANVLMSDATGEFEILVPVGIHEVIAKKPNHIFENGGRITDSYLVDLNYQDEVLGLKLNDLTTVKYIGRVAGGAIQDDYPLGHSLSTNNLADGIKVTLTTKNPAYKILNEDRSENFDHLIPSNQGGDGWPKINTVEYSQEAITIYPNAETGEFIAEVIPETFTVRVEAVGHDDISGSGEDLNLTQSFFNDSEVYEYIDSSLVNGVWTKVSYSDTAFFNKSQKFIKRYSPTVRISQLDGSGKTLSYFGDTLYTASTLDNTEIEIELYKDNSYVLGLPVFKQNDFYNFKSEVFEEYIYYTIDGNPNSSIAPDEVPTQDATIEFTNNLSVYGIAEVEADMEGVALYEFQVTEPELTSAIRAISAKIYYGSDDNRTSINWNGAFTGIIIGAVQTGRDFVTGGPDEILMVLRDPPGSNSFSFLEKGVSVTKTHSYNGSITNEGQVSLQADLGQDVVTYQGTPFAGTIISVEATSGLTVGVVHGETISGGYSNTTVTTATTRFQTSDDPSYVGADADVFVGYSTNITYGATENVRIISQSTYQENTSKYEVYTNITEETAEWLLVKQTGLGIAQSFSTLFAYPQVHITDRLLPEMEALRNNFLMQEAEMPANIQALANGLDTTFYISHLSPDHTDYGKSNNDMAFDNIADPYPDDAYNGVSYQVVFPERDDFTRSDTILYLNQSINRWYTQLEANEKAKIDANLLQNYSFHGGSPVEYSESYAAVNSGTWGFEVMIGLNFNKEAGVSINSKGFNLSVDETIKTQHGYEGSNESERNTCKGFVLAEENEDYISVDVMYEDAELDLDDFYPSFIFRTKAGATSCPYEGANVSRYYEAGQHVIDEATKKIEVPEIAVEQDFIENIPSGGTANFMLYLRNNSEIKLDNWFTLKIVDESNPNGAKLLIDGAPIGNGRDFLVPAGGTLSKTLEVGKGAVLNYDNLQLVLQSQCQDDIADTLTFTVHFTPSCSEVEIEKPSDKWTYNTKLPVVTIDGVDKHYIDVRISGFDVNHDSFNRIKLQYKSSAESDDGWKTLMNYYSDSALYMKALDDGFNAEFIDPANAGTIKYILKMDDLPDQLYDLRSVSVCLINNEEIENISETASGIKDMLCPRLFGSPLPANGILTIQDEIRLNFNEQIAEGLLTKNNFQVTGIRNGAKTDHSVSISFDGINDYMATEFDKNMANKDISVEMWIKTDDAQNATLFSHGNINESLEMSLTQDNHLQLKLGNNVVTSQNAVAFEAGSWAHVAFVYTRSGQISGFYNFTEVISSSNIGYYTGIGNFVLGKDISQNNNFFNGLMHNVRVWNKELTSGELQVKSLAQLSGNEPGLLAYYPMAKAKGIIAEDKARGANMIINGCIWSIPEGRAIGLNGSDSYVKINTGSSAVIKGSMDYTIEFWFKGEPGQTNATLLCNGRGDGLDLGGSDDLFSIEIDTNGKLCFRNNGFTSTLDSNYIDNNWHHIAVNISRTIGRGQIYLDGNLQNYFDSKDLGGIASSLMYIGARGWYEEGVSNYLNLDNYFNGEIDELRIWNLYKNEQLIKDNNNVKLDGAEMGLLAYYPFETYIEWQGQQELAFTFADMKIQRDEAMVVPDAENINADEISDIPPVKDKGPVSDLEFDFVVNNDALIIYLEETLEKIEKTIVTFTVDNIQDINGNENISPITWSAYIDRNQLKWSETSINVSKLVSEPHEFTVKAVNMGGAIQYFNMENMPSWIEVAPKSGWINPGSSVDVTFEIDEGLNVGTYDEVIYMINDNNVPEALEITINVRGEKPDWKVNPADYSYSMSIFGKMRFNNIYSADEGDMLASFYNGKCIGVTNSYYYKDLDMWYALLNVYSNDDQINALEFRMWDASTGITYLADVSETITFVNNSIVGTPADLIIFDAREEVYQNIELVPGWNWISFNVKSSLLNNLDETLKNMNWNSSNFFKSEAENISANYSYVEEKWIEEKELVLNNSLMYKVSSSVEQFISIPGTIITPSKNPTDVKAGLWNYISYLPTVMLTLDEALAGYDAKLQDVIKSQDAFAMYADNFGWVGSLQFLEPNKGYMMYRNDVNDVNFIYPDNSGSMSNKSAGIGIIENEYVNKSFSSNMNIVAASNINTIENDRILAYVGNELNSETANQHINKKDIFFITVTGNNNMPVSFALERNGEVIGTTTAPFSFTADNVSGTIWNPLILDFSNQQNKILVYPNPVTNELSISLNTQQSDNIEVRIVDITGKLMIIREIGKSFSKGIYNIQIDCNNLQSGIYFAVIKVNEEKYIRKIVKL